MMRTRRIYASDRAREGTRARRARVVRIAGPALPYDRTYHLLGPLRQDPRAGHRAERPDVLEAHSPYLGGRGRAGGGPKRELGCGRPSGTPIIVRTCDVCWSRGWARRRTRCSLLWAASGRSLAPFDATFVAGVCAGRASCARIGVANVVARAVRGRRAGLPPRRERARRHGGAPRRGPRGRGAPRRRRALRGREAVGRRARRVRAGAGAAARRSSSCSATAPSARSWSALAPPGVRFVGFETDRATLASALASADVLVHGCPYETFGLGVAEAMRVRPARRRPGRRRRGRERRPRPAGEVYREPRRRGVRRRDRRLLAREPASCAPRGPRRAATRVPTRSRSTSRACSAVVRRPAAAAR